MNPKAATAHKQKIDPKASPFELITEREDVEEKRLNQVLERVRVEEIDAERTMAEAEKHAEEKLRDITRKELTAHKEFIGKELVKSEKAIEKDLEKFDEHYAKNAPRIIEQQVETLLSFEF